VQMYVSSFVVTPAGGYANLYLNGAGSVSATGAGFTSASIERLGATDWYRIVATFTCNNTSSQTLSFCTLITGSETRAPTILGTSRTVYYFGPQVEAATSLSSYIPTTTAAVTRAADALYYEFASPIAQPNTVYVEAKAPNWASSVLGGSLVETKAASSGDRVSIGRVTYDTKLSTKTQIGYSNQCDIFPSGAVAAGDSFKAAYRNETNNFQGSRNASLGVADTSGTGAAINRIYVGSGNDGASSHWFGYVKAAKIYNVGKSNTDLQAMTS